MFQIALAASLSSVACVREDPCEGDGPPASTRSCVCESSFRTCATLAEELGKEGFARSVGLDEGDPAVIADAFARPFPTFPEAARDGCLAALREST